MRETDRGGVRKLRAIFYRFAAMFPDKVGRVLIDGVANAHNYYNGERVSLRYSDHMTDNQLRGLSWQSPGLRAGIDDRLRGLLRGRSFGLRHL